MSACAPAVGAQGESMESDHASNPAPADGANDGERSADEHHVPGKDTDVDEISSSFGSVSGVINKDRNARRKDDLRQHADLLAELFHDRCEEGIDEVMEHLVHTNEGKRLFVCCDGTWNNALGTAAPMTNVAKLARAVRSVGKEYFRIPKELEPWRGPLRQVHRYGFIRQIVHYASGVGTQSSLAVDKLFSGAFGKGIDTNILNAYCFLCNNFNADFSMNEIILVGFSRGAFTVRCLAHFINKVGILRRRGLVFLETIYSAWIKGTTEVLEKKLEALSELRAYPVRVHVLAEWDTVSAIRSFRPWKKRFAFVRNEVPSNVNHAFHAISLHEKRKSFKPMLWEKAEVGTRVEQCAFVGCHSDIGGGNTDPGLSTVSLLWMVSRICDVSQASFNNEALFPFIAPFQSRIPAKLFNPLTWGKSQMRLDHLMTTPGRVNESRRGFWLLPYYLTLGRFHGKRDRVIQQFAQSRKAKTDGMNRNGTRAELRSLITLGKTLEQIENSLPEDEKRKYRALERDMTHAWLWASPVQMKLQIAALVLTEMKWSLSEEQISTLWLAHQEARRTWLKLEMPGDVGLQIHFTARLLHSRLASDSRLKCGLFRQFEPNDHTQEWLERSSRVLSLAEASVLVEEMKLLREWLKASRSLRRNERNKSTAILDDEKTDWSAIQGELVRIGWGDYVDGCTFYSSLTGLIDREFKRLGVSPPKDTDGE